MSQSAEPAAETRPKPIIDYWPSHTAPDIPSSRSSSTSVDDDSVSGTLNKPHIVRSSSSLPTRITSPCLSVKFAPLPVIEPRKRKSSVQLGVAARSRMIQSRRNMDQAAPSWDDADDAVPVQETSPLPAGEDPFEVFGKFVRGKSKYLWQRISSKPTSPPAAVVIGQTFTDNADADTLDIVRTPTDGSIASEEASPGDNAGGIVEDEIGELFQLRMKRVSSTANEREKRTKQTGPLGKSPSTTATA